MTPQEPLRTYGGWRRSRGVGLFGLGTAATFAVLAAFLSLLLVAAVSVQALLYVAPPVLLAGGGGLARVGGIPLAQLGVQRLRWWWGTRRGYTGYRAEVVHQHAGVVQLPGLLTATELLEAEDGFGGHYGIVRDRHTGYLTATLRVVPTSTWLADREDADTWVANWGAWLASLGYIPALRWVTVTVDTAPEPGSTLADTVAAALDLAAPQAARHIMAQLVATAPAAAADVDTRVSLTFDPSASPAGPKTLQEAIAETGRTLQGLESQLGCCGVTVTGRARAADIAGICRTAFDPAVRGDVNRLLAAGGDLRRDGRLNWASAGPSGAEELWDRYRHGSGVSVSWSWREAPRQNVHADVLARLTAPTAWPKRVTLQYRPLPASAATRALENEVRAAEFRQEYFRRTRRDATARDTHDHARARQAASEEAQGAGVTLVALYVTVTAAGDEHLPRAVAAVEAAADSSKVQLQRMYGSQAAGFTATLPCGVCLPELARRMRH